VSFLVRSYITCERVLNAQGFQSPIDVVDAVPPARPRSWASNCRSMFRSELLNVEYGSRGLCNTGHCQDCIRSYGTDVRCPDVVDPDSQVHRSKSTIRTYISVVALAFALVAFVVVRVGKLHLDQTLTVYQTQ
jgi:hypothetical protein